VRKQIAIPECAIFELVLFDRHSKSNPELNYSNYELNYIMFSATHLGIYLFFFKINLTWIITLPLSEKRTLTDGNK
jgi:hypothetical protein